MGTNKRGIEVAQELVAHEVYRANRKAELAAMISPMVRLAKEYEKIQERHCSEDMSDAIRACVERRESKIEAAFKEWAASLPKTSKGEQPRVKFTGDPRGYCVRLVIPKEPHLGNTWGRDGEYGL